MKTQKTLAAKILKTSPKKIKFKNDRLAEVKEAITKQDIRELIEDEAIVKLPDKGISRARANKIKTQKAKGLRKGLGSRKGKKTARLPRKKAWMNKIRAQRVLLKELKENNKISNETFRKLYLRSKGGFFRSKRHIKIYLQDNNLILSDKK